MAMSLAGRENECIIDDYKRTSYMLHDDVIKCKHFPRYWPIVRGIHRLPVNSPHKGPWRGALMFSLICALNKRLSKQSWGWWFDTPSRSLWRHCNDMCSRCFGTIPKYNMRSSWHGNDFHISSPLWENHRSQVDNPASKVHGANMGPIWGRYDPGGPHVDPMNFAIWDPSQRARNVKIWYFLRCQAEQTVE